MYTLFFLTVIFDLNIVFGDSGDIVRKKCTEYAKAVYVKEDSPVLLPNAKSDLISTCGMVEVPLIIGGVKAAPKEFPHMAVIGIMERNELVWKCGGSLISEKHILTAAHCVVGNITRVRLGELDFTQSGETDIQEYAVIKRIRHPLYNPLDKYYDIAIFILEQSVKFSAFVRPVCINTNRNITGAVIAAGFGKTSMESMGINKYLMKVQLHITDRHSCNSTFKPLILPPFHLSQGIREDMLCAGEPAGGKDTCEGDSGGPLQVALKDPYCMYSLIGITSFGEYFCGSADPAVYTNVAYYVDWIEEVVWGNLSKL